MNAKLSSAIEVLLEQLQAQLQDVAETKKIINNLRKRMGEEPQFPDVSVELVGGGPIRADQYYGKPLATAAQEYLEQRRQACPAEEILRGLAQGGFDFRAVGWQEKDRLRNLSISLAKNTKAFHRLPNGTFGLVSFYPELARRPDRNNRERAEETT